MVPTTREQTDAQQRRTAVKMYQAGTPAAVVAQHLHRSRSWVYKGVRYRERHPWTRFRSAPCAPPPSSQSDALGQRATQRPPAAAVG